MSDDPVRLIVVDDFRTAHDGAQALAMIDGFEPHCMLFDIDMPGIDGLELSRRVRERHDNDIVLIAVTARLSHDPRVARASRVADHYFSKPVDPRLLCKVLPLLRARGGPKS